MANGLVTRSDVLLAAVKQGEVETQLAAAQGQAALARFQLALLLGTPDDTAFTLPAAVRIPRMSRPKQAPRPGPMFAWRRRVAAAARRTRPRTRHFSPGSTASRGMTGTIPIHWPVVKSMWTVGVMASWSPFTGGAELAARRTAAAEVQAARAGSEAVRAGAALEVQSAEVAVTVASRGLTIASHAVAQATEAHRIVGRKYEGGLAAVTELLDAQATELGTRPRRGEGPL